MATDRQQADDNARYQIEIGLAYAEPRRADYRTEGFYSRALREWKTLEAFYDRTGLARPNVLTVIFPEPELVREYQPAQLGRQHTKSDLERSIAMSRSYVVRPSPGGNDIALPAYRSPLPGSATYFSVPSGLDRITRHP
jgi:hypothetical protein